MSAMICRSPQMAIRRPSQESANRRDGNGESAHLHDVFTSEYANPLTTAVISTPGTSREMHWPFST
jgi:hypothetical protein